MFLNYYQVDTKFLGCDELLFERTGYSVWTDLPYFEYCAMTYHRVDSLCCGQYVPLDIVCGSTREWIYCILDIAHILVLFIYLVFYVILNRSYHDGYLEGQSKPVHPVR